MLKDHSEREPMIECIYKEGCPYLGYASPKEILTEKSRLEKWLTDKDKLIELAAEEIQKRDKRISELESQIEEFKKALKEAHQAPFKKKKKDDTKDNNDENESGKKEPKKRGAPKGHRGATRPKPKHIDEYKDVYAEKCKKCSSENIKHSAENFDEHIVEDIEIVVITKTTCYRHHKYYCYDCKHTGSSGPAKDELPGSFIGPQAKAIGGYLRHYIGMTYGQVEKLTAGLLGLTVTRPALVGFDKAIHEKGKPFYELLKQRMYLSSYCCIDETGWLVLTFGPGWLWVFTNDSICLYVIHKRRSSEVVKLVLGEDYLGIIVSDCLSSYNPVSAGGKQKCVTHILRKNKEVQQYPGIDEQVNLFTKQVKDLFQEALALKKKWKAGEVTEQKLSCEATAFKEKLEEITACELLDEGACNLRDRLIRHKEELFTFLTHPYVPADNNLSERSLKPCIIHRKLMYFNTTEQGARHYEAIMSLTQTAKRNGQDALELLKKLLTGAKHEEIIENLFGERAKDCLKEKQFTPEGATKDIAPPTLNVESDRLSVASGYG